MSSKVSRLLYEALGSGANDLQVFFVGRSTDWQVFCESFCRALPYMQINISSNEAIFPPGSTEESFIERLSSVVNDLELAIERVTENRLLSKEPFELGAQILAHSIRWVERIRRTVLGKENTWILPQIKSFSKYIREKAYCNKCNFSYLPQWSLILEEHANEATNGQSFEKVFDVLLSKMLSSSDGQQIKKLLMRYLVNEMEHPLDRVELKELFVDIEFNIGNCPDHNPLKT